MNRLHYTVDDHGGVTIAHKPVGKPRQTRSDKWKRRPSVMKYRAYATILRIVDNKTGGRLTEILDTGRVRMIFFMPIPKSRTQDEGDPHQVTPDIDNLCKSVFDALCKNDSHIYDLSARKQYTHGIPGVYINEIGIESV